MADPIDPREQLEQAIAALEGQRSALGDAVVDTALGPMREKLSQLRAQTTSVEQRRKQVTVLFADVSGFTALAENLDVERTTELLNALWQHVDAIITQHHGQIDKHIGDSVMALWGVEAAREDDPERALLAGLDIQAAVSSFCAEHEVQLGMRVGINTGPVLLGEVGSKREFTAMGDTVNLASRLQHVAPVGGMLISHTAYQHVRGLFEILPQAPLAIKGKSGLVQTYVVQRALPRAFHVGARGVEGVETRMVGRAAELQMLQNAFAQVVEKGQTRLVTVVGEAGMGKSRLLYEFERWLQHRPEQKNFFRARATLTLQGMPYSILRSMFIQRFDILESDNAAARFDKFRRGMANILPPDRADLVGHLIGFDFSTSPIVQNLIGSPDFSKLALAYLTHYVRTLAQSQLVIIFIEDLHWADDSSLNLVQRLWAEIHQARLMIVGMARPVLFDRRPDWGQAPATGVEPEHTSVRIDLNLLSRQDSQALADDILQKVPDIPSALRDLVVDRAEGNPFYLEELIKMLIDEGVIERGSELWRVNPDRLQQVRVPTTLTGTLQARLDSLPRAERGLLQRAAVVGRIFWDGVVAELIQEEQEILSAALDAVSERELIFRNMHSAFANAQEYSFKHALLREVTYETVLLKLRRSYHARVAHWLEKNAGEHCDEYTALIAEHLERAGQAAEAVRYLRQAAEKALAAGAYHEMLGFASRALALLPDDSPERIWALLQQARALLWLGNYGQAREQLEAGMAAAQQFGDAIHVAAALDDLGLMAREQGDLSQAQTYLEQSLAMARQNNDRARVAHVLQSLGWVCIRQGLHEAARTFLLESQALYQSLGDQHGLILVSNGLGMVALGREDYPLAQSLYLRSLELSRQTGARRNEAVALGNLGESAWRQQDYAMAKHYTQEAMEIFKEIGARSNIAVVTANLGHVAAALGDDAVARSHFQEALRIATETKTIPNTLDSLAGLAGVLAHTGKPQQALELLGLILNHPALDSYTMPVIERVLARLRATHFSEEIEAGLARGKALNLETVVTDSLRWVD